MVRRPVAPSGTAPSPNGLPPSYVSRISAESQLTPTARDRRPGPCGNLSYDIR